MNGRERRSPPGARRPYPKLLFVDDDRDTVYFIERELQRKNINVLFAGSAEEGLRIALDTLPNYIVCDLTMPGGADGLAFGRMVRAQWQLSKVRMLLITNATCTANLVQDAKDAGFITCVEKPDNPADLFSTLLIALLDEKPS